jgi:hypothetical protein
VAPTSCGNGASAATVVSVRRWLTSALGVTLVVLVSATAVGASHVPGGAPLGEDFVTGSGAGPFGATGMVHTFDAHSGPSGEDARGTTESRFGTLQLHGSVICLAVTANRATIGVAISPNPTDVQAAFFFVEDHGGAGQDQMAFEVLQQLPTVCPTSPPLTPPFITEGDLTVHDAPPQPTAKDQCKEGGWRNLGVSFQNQGHCVAFVQRGPKP